MLFPKIKSRTSGIVLYGITPPKAETPPEKIKEIAERCLEKVSGLDIDALVVYDVQDESARTSEERPFPFASSLDPFEYASQYLQRLAIPKIIYRPAGKYTTHELSQWLHGLNTHGFHPVFVGLPAPDYVVKTSLTEAYQLWRDHFSQNSVLGAVTIPERHAILKDEDIRMLDKMNCGVSYFISQCIFNLEYTRKTLEDLVAACEKNNVQIPTVIFTLSICGSPKTLSFMEWLGIHIPEDVKADLMLSEDALKRSVEIAVTIAKDLIQYCMSKSIPFGFNIESVAIRKVEVDASIELIRTISSMLKDSGLRNHLAENNSLIDQNQPAIKLARTA